MLKRNTFVNLTLIIRGTEDAVGKDLDSSHHYAHWFNSAQQSCVHLVFWRFFLLQRFYLGTSVFLPPQKLKG